MVRTEPKTYENTAGDIITTQVMIMDATVKSIPSHVRTNKGGNQKQWRLCQVTIATPDGKATKDVPAQLWEASYEQFADQFAVGEEIELEVQLEGDSKGYAKMQLPSLERIDVDAFLEAAELQVDKQVVDKELVI